LEKWFGMLRVECCFEKELMCRPGGWIFFLGKYCRRFGSGSNFGGPRCYHMGILSVYSLYPSWKRDPGNRAAQPLYFFSEGAHRHIGRCCVSSMRRLAWSRSVSFCGGGGVAYSRRVSDVERTVFFIRVGSSSNAGSTGILHTAGQVGCMLCLVAARGVESASLGQREIGERTGHVSDLWPLYREGGVDGVGVNYLSPGDVGDGGCACIR
jgi:hypothetical protein